MKYDLPPLTCLPAFEAAARRLSFTKAASELCLTQAAVSFQVRNLEKALATELFVRGHRMLTLTPAGQELFETTHNTLEKLARKKAQIMSEKLENEIVLSAPVSFSSKWLVSRLHRLPPNINLLIDANDNILQLDDYTVQLAIRYCIEPPSGMNAIELITDVVFPVCSPQYKIPNKENFQLSDLNNATLLHDQMKDFTWKDWFKAIKSPNIIAKDGISFSHTGNAIDAAVAGQGIALGRFALIADDLATGKLVRPFNEVGQSSYAYFLLRSSESMNNPDVDVITNWLISESALSKETIHPR